MGELVPVRDETVQCGHEGVRVVHPEDAYPVEPLLRYQPGDRQCLQVPSNRGVGEAGPPRYLGEVVLTPREDYPQQLHSPVRGEHFFNLQHRPPTPSPTPQSAPSPTRAREPSA